MTTPADLRSSVQTLTGYAESDLRAVWQQITTPDAARPVLMETIPALVGDYSDAAAVVSAEWYDEHRAELNVKGSYHADIPPASPAGAEALAGWGASLVTGPEIDWDAAFVRVLGGLERRIANASRDTITTNTYRDPQALGWQRVARVNGCGFCQMLAGRGVVYRSEGTADFASHDHCHCSAAPAFGGRPVPVKPYTPSGRTITDADRARVRAWLANH